MKFLPLLDLSIKHLYYADGRCPDFLLTAAPETNRLLCNLRGVLKSRADGVSVVVPVDEKQSLPFIPLPKNVTFTFQLNLKNPDFPLFTDLATVTTHTGAAGSDATCQLRYPVKSGREGARFALVDITAAFAQLTENPPAFTVEFTARQLRWSYYFVTDLSDGGAEFTIIDADPTSSPVTFEQHPDPTDPDPVAALLARQYPDIKRWQFVSAAALTCQQRPRKNLQLRLGDSKLFEHLPNPSIRNCTRIDVAGRLEDTFYQVVKYISDSSLTRV